MLNANSQHHLGAALSSRPDSRQRIAAAKAFDVPSFELETGTTNPIENHLRRSPRFVLRIATADHQRTGGRVTIFVRQRHFVAIGCRLAACTTDGYTILPTLFEPNLAEIGDDVGCEIVCGIADFINQLFRHGTCRHAASRVFGLGDDTRPIIAHRDNRVSYIGERQRIVPVGIHASADLCPAFDEMPRHRGCCKLAPVIPRPAEFMYGGSDRQRGVGNTPGHHDPCTGLQGVDNPGGSQIGVRADDPRRNLVKRCPGIEILERLARSAK